MFEALFKANQIRIQNQIQRLNIRYDWYDEFFTEGIATLWTAYQVYDDRKGAVGNSSLTAFAFDSSHS